MLEHSQDWKNDVRELCESYNQDIPNIAGLEAELILWERLWNEKKAKEEDIPDRLTVLQVLATIPISSSSSERSISTLRNLKKLLEVHNEP